MDGERFDQLARWWAGGTRRQVTAGVLGLLATALPDITVAKPKPNRKRKQKHKTNQRPNDRRQARRGKRNDLAERRGVQSVSDEACAGTGAACATDAGCCVGRCDQAGPCTKKKKGKKKKKVLTGACTCVDPPCVPDNAAACAGLSCGSAATNCGTVVSCGSCAGNQTCQGGRCVAGPTCAQLGTCETVPEMPAGLQAEALDTSRIRLTWSDVARETGYRLHNGDQLVATLNANTTSYTVTGLSPNTYRCHHVQAFNTAGDSPWTDWACTSTTSGCVPDNTAACAGKQCGNATNNCGSTVSCGTCSTNQTCQNGSCVTTCTPNCAGKSCGSDGCNGSCGICTTGRTCQNGSCVSVCTPDCSGKVCGSDGCNGSCGTCSTGRTCLNGSCVAPPAQPTGVQAVALDTTRIRLTWNDVSGETGYRIHDGERLVATLPVNTTSYTVTGLPPNTWKCHFVQAFNDVGSSEWSTQSCTSTQSVCSQDTHCNDGNVCTVDLCEQGICNHRAAACKVRLLIVLPSDWMGSTTHQQLGSPSQATILQAGRNARDRIKTFFSQKAELPLRFDDVQVLVANHDTEWFNTAPANAARSPEKGRFVFEEEYMSPPGSETQPGARTSVAAASWDPSHQWGRMFSYLQEAGLGGPCASGWISLVILGSTWRGGFAGGGVCGTALKQLPNSAPDTGPHPSGIAMVGQWVLDCVITGQTSISCEQRQGGDPAGGPGAWQCPANTAWGTLIHELGHTLSLNHPDSAWETQNWNLSPATWATMVMMNHSGYPNVGFHPYERAVLAGLPPLQSGAASFAAAEEQQQGDRASRTDKRHQPSKTDRDENRSDRSKRRDKKGSDRSKHRGSKGANRSKQEEPMR